MLRGAYRTYGNQAYTPWLAVYFPQLPVSAAHLIVLQGQQSSPPDGHQCTATQTQGQQHWAGQAHKAHQAGWEDQAFL